MAPDMVGGLEGSPARAAWEGACGGALWPTGGGAGATEAGGDAPGATGGRAGATEAGGDAPTRPGAGAIVAWLRGGVAGGGLPAVAGAVFPPDAGADGVTTRGSPLCRAGTTRSGVDRTR